MNKQKILSQFPNPGEAERGVEGRIGYLLRQANLIHRTMIDNALKDLNVTLPQYSVLAYLDVYPGISNADLARLTLLTPQTLSVIVNNLEKRGTISRSPHPIHQRIQCIELSKAGKKLHDRCTVHVLKIQENLLSGLSKKEEEIIRRWLVAVAKI